ncbi:MAG: dihydroorotate dehydrogenase electron transfer subunit, partial [Anaerolineae bacterium]|nr:dihydroorotate dehydrogenase electron transfer subunit [Anaerolineae bacterium]
MNRFTLPTAARISAIESDNYRTKTFVLDARLDAVPGQFVMAWLPRFDEKPFSLVNADPVTLMITAVGPFTRLVHELQVGDRLWLRGPF